MASQPSAAVLSFSELHRDGRVQRQIRALASICRVTAMGWTDPCIEGVRFVDVGQRPRTTLETALMACRLKARRFEAVYRSQQSVRKAAEALQGHDFSLVVANDIYALPVALTHQGSARVLFDAHEYSPRQFENWFLWRFFIQDYKEYLCRTRIPRADAMTTVALAIAEEYARAFGVRPALVLNTPHYRPTSYAPRHDDTIRLVHHGVAIRQRRLEIMIDAMAQLDDRFRLELMLLPGNSRYVNSLKKRASGDPRIAFHPPVPPEQVVEALLEYDVGLYSLPPYSLNARHALPNKFFDFIQARLCIVIGPSPEMRKLVEQYECGVVAQDFEADALARALRTLDRRKVETCRRATDAAAADLCYEKSAEVFLGEARRLLQLDGNDRTGGKAAALAG